ncbi:transglutaminase domain-containing protein [Rufibacter immobilis]|uniref:transglutaminase domain-containing protein n=1 Tax=Rufibacter immobilis TaxID=1348778 RepID=UPI0035EF8782
MKKILLSLFLSFVLVKGYSNSTLNAQLYEYSAKAPATNQLEQLVAYLVKPTKSDKEKVEIFFYWISQNIKYDLELESNGQRTWPDVAVEKTLREKKTICSGYSLLLAAMCEEVGIECQVVNGYVQYYLEAKPSKIYSNHAWNAVKIGREWKLVDATWGSGGFDYGSVEYSPNMDLRYLFADPKFLLIDHFPLEEKWQLQKQPITFQTFLGKAYHELRFRKFNKLLDDVEYKQYLEAEKQAKEYQNKY